MRVEGLNGRIEATNLGIARVHEGLDELKKDELQVCHEAVRGHGFRVDLHSGSLDIELDATGDESKEGFATLGGRADDGVAHFE